jgi:hypothetical protein
MEAVGEFAPDQAEMTMYARPRRHRKDRLRSGWLRLPEIIDTPDGRRDHDRTADPRSQHQTGGTLWNQ